MPAASKPSFPPDALVSLRARRNRRLAGDIPLPAAPATAGLALIGGALAIGETRLDGLAASDDILGLAAALRALGVGVEALPENRWRLFGRGIGGLLEPDSLLDAGSAAPLLLGLLATHPLTATLTGKRTSSLAPVLRALARFGARWTGRADGFLPLTLSGAAKPVGVSHTLPADAPRCLAVALKQAVLLAGLNTPGETTVIEPVPLTDPSEAILAAFGVDIRVETGADGARAVTLSGQPELTGRTLTLPGDATLAGGLAVAGLIVPGSEIVLRSVDANPASSSLMLTLQEMGATLHRQAPLHRQHERVEAAMPVVDVTVRSSALTGIRITADRTRRLGDAVALLVTAAACATGETRIEGVAAARDLVTPFAACGVALRQEGDSLIVPGAGQPPAGGAHLSGPLDPTVALGLLSLGLATPAPVVIESAAGLLSAFPSCIDLITRLGGDLEDIS